MWREASRAGQGGAQGHGLAGADFPGDHAEGVLADAPADPGGCLAVGGVAVQHARCQVTAERHSGEPVVGLESLDAHSSSWAFSASASSMVIWPGSSAGPGGPGGGSLRPAKLMASPASSGVVGGVDQPDVVDASGRGRRGGLLGPGLGVGVAADDVRDRLSGGVAVPAHLDDGQVEGVEDQLDLPAGE